MRTLLLIACVLLLAPTAKAGVFEIGVGGSYKRTNIADDAYDESTSLSGSFSYYLDEMSAIELSYTDGVNKRFLGLSTATTHTTSIFYTIVGLDFVLTLGDKAAVLRPYVKAGVGYLLRKRLVDQYQGFAPTIVEDPPGLVPSAGAGIKISLTQNLSLKLGVDGWTSRPLDSNPILIDYVARAGLSWMF